jgi:hypothetical protein
VLSIARTLCRLREHVADFEVLALLSEGKIMLDDAKTRLYSVKFANLCNDDTPEFRVAHLARNGER